MSAMTVINGGYLVTNNQATLIKAGDTTSDTDLQSAIQAAGGQLFDASNSFISNAAAIVQTMRARGATEQDCINVMMGAFVLANS